MVSRMRRLRWSAAGSCCRCESRCPSTWRSVSATKPRLSASLTAAAAAPMAKEPGVPEGIQQAGRAPSSLQPLFAPGQVIAFLARGLQQEFPGGRRSRASRAWPWYRAWAAISPAWLTRISPAAWRRSAVPRGAASGRSGAARGPRGRGKQGPEGIVRRPKQAIDADPARSRWPWAHYRVPAAGQRNPGGGRGAGPPQRLAALQSGGRFEYTSAPIFPEAEGDPGPCAARPARYQVGVCRST